MEIFKIRIEETLSEVVEVQAETSSEAISKVAELYKKSEIVLDYNNFVGVEFLICEPADDSKNQPA